MRIGRTAVFVSSGILATGCPWWPDVAAKRYTIEVVDLLFVEPKGDSLNDFNEVVGRIRNSSNVGIGVDPAVWSTRGVIAIEHYLEDGWLNGINNQGLVVGINFFNDRCCPFWSTLVSSVGAPQPFGPEVSFGTAYSINEQNQFVGEDGYSHPPVGLTGFVSSATVTPLTSDDHNETRAYDINDAGAIVGSGGPLSEHIGDTFAVCWRLGVDTTLPSLGGPFSEAYAINNQETIVGVSSRVDEGRQRAPRAAAAWFGDEIVELPGLGGDESGAWDVNNRGEAVGFAIDEKGRSRAVLWRTNNERTAIGVVDLNSLVLIDDPRLESLILVDAIDINEHGTILCVAEPPDIEFSDERVYLLLMSV